MSKRAWTMLGAAVVAVGLGFGCESEPPLPKVDCTMVTTVPKYSELTILKVCNQCHASTISGTKRYDAPTDVNYDSYAAAKAKAEDAAREVNGGDMPPDDAAQDLGQLDHEITDAEKTALYEWALCGTPE